MGQKIQSNLDASCKPIASGTISCSQSHLASVSTPGRPPDPVKSCSFRAAGSTPSRNRTFDRQSHRHHLYCQARCRVGRGGVGAELSKQAITPLIEGKLRVNIEVRQPDLRGSSTEGGQQYCRTARAPYAVPSGHEEYGRK